MRFVNLAGAVFLLALLFCRLDGASAQGSDAARQACTPDAMRLCSDFISDVSQTTRCMMAKRAQWSPACRAAMGHRAYHRAYRHYAYCRHGRCRY